MFLVMGYEEGHIVCMTQRPFETYKEAQDYADSCIEGWDAFVVKVMQQSLRKRT